MKKAVSISAVVLFISLSFTSCTDTDDLSTYETEQTVDKKDIKPPTGG